MKHTLGIAATFVAAGLTAAGTPAAAGWFGTTITGSGKIVSEARTVPSFDRIGSKGSATIVVTVGPAQTVTVKADDNVVPIVETTVRDGRLEIGTKQGYSSDADVTVTITVPSLKAVGLSGSGDVSVTGVSGAEFTAAVAGSGDVTVSGKAEKVSVAVSGSGDVHLYGLAAHAAEVSIAGSGDVEVSASDTLSASIAGSGDVSYRGKPQIRSKIAGSGDVRPAASEI